jgi:O-succinylbenzoic acid--CoA ligase
VARALEPVELTAGVRALAALPALGPRARRHRPALLPLAPGSAAPAELLGDATVEEPVALVVATSGSTGRPKGVLLPASALHASAAATQARLGGPAQWLLAVPPHNVAGVLVLVRSVLAGTEPVVLDLAAGFRAGAFVEATDRLTGSRRNVSLVPTQLARVLDDAEAAAALATYDAVLVGGAATPAALLDRARDADVRVVTTYGMTETCGGCVYDGRPLDGVTVDADGGVLRIRGPVVASGYRNDPGPDGPQRSSTAGSSPRPRPGQRRRHGGGARPGRRHRGDRRRQRRSGSCRGSAAGAPGVAAAAVFGRADSTWGQRVVAVVVPRGTAPSHAELARSCGARGPGRRTARAGPHRGAPPAVRRQARRVTLRTLRGEVWEG